MKKNKQKNGRKALKNSNTGLYIFIGIIIAIILSVGGYIAYTDYTVTNKLELARYLIDRGDIDSAQKIIEDILTKHPNNKKALELLDEILQRKKGTFNKQKKVTPTPPKTTVVTPPLTKNTIPPKTTTDQTKPAKDKNIDQYLALIKKGEIEYNKGNYLKAIEYFEEAKKIVDNDYRAYHFLAKSHYATRDQSNSTYQEILKNGEKAVSLKKDDADSYAVMGLAHLDHKKYPQAEDNFGKALSIDPNNIRGLEGMIQIYQYKNDIENAKKAAEKLVSLDPENIVGNEFLGQYYTEKGDYDKTISHLSKVFSKEKNHKYSNFLLARAYYIKKMYSKTIEVLTESIKYSPQYVEEYMFLGLSYDKTNNNTMANAFLDKGIKETNMFDKSYQYKIYFNYGFVLTSQGNYPKAIAMTEKALEINPSFIDAIRQLGWLYMLSKNYAESIKYYEMAIEKGDNQYTTYYSLAEAYLRNGDPNKALLQFNNALTANKNVENVNERSDNYSKIFTVIGNMIIQQDNSSAYKYFAKAIQYSSPYIETYTGILQTIMKDTALTNQGELAKYVATGESKIKKTIDLTANVNNEIKIFFHKSAFCFMQYESYTDAVKYEQKAIEKDRLFADAYDVIIDALMKLERYKEALAYIDAYLAFAPESKRSDLFKKIEYINSKTK